MSFEILIQSRKDNAKQKEVGTAVKGEGFFWVKFRLGTTTVILSPHSPFLTHFMSCQIRCGTYEAALQQAIISSPTRKFQGYLQLFGR